MHSVRIVLKSRGIKSLLRSAEVRSDLERRAAAIKSAAGDGFESDSRTGTNRAHASVYTDTYDAMVAEARNRTLTRALTAGRG